MAVPADCDPECRFRAISKGCCPFRRASCERGKVLQREGADVRAAHYLREGRVALTTTDASGIEAALGVRGAGSTLGFEAALCRPSLYRVTTLEPTRLCVLDAARFRAWLGSLDTPAGAVLRATLEESSRQLRERHALHGNALCRLARYLLQASSTVGLSHQLVAHGLNMRPETLSRLLSQLRQQGYVDSSSGVVVLNREALERLAIQGE